ncbi:hypothetical protein EC957_010575 [Mortierella hygrophila]|uniref:Uncharacterized protein n=1 Tax=Mortierella hygrophila TaxID=979708 RepID=A0A9P6FA86_9FUNG|nr:hypothetical protein EC957_010575 [Mortierella hygrophila]
MEPYQQFRLGTRIEALAVRRDPKRDYFYNRLTDIQHYFPTAWGFKVNSINILFLEDEHEQCFEPKRIAHYPNAIIDIVTANNSQEEQPQQSSTPTNLFDETNLQLTADLDNNKQKDIGPSSQHDVDQSVPTLSVQPNTAVTTRPRRATFGASSPPVPLPDSLVTKSSPISMDALLDNQPQEQQQQQQQQPYQKTKLVYDSSAPLLSTAPTEEHYFSQDSAPNHDKVLQQQLADTQSSPSSEHSHDADDDEQQGHHMKDRPQEQHQTMVELVMAQRKLDAAFLPNDELYEYPIPRLFVLLPPSFTNKYPSGEPLQNFRLYFLCECGDQCEKHSNSNSSNNSSTAEFASPSNKPTTKPITEPPGTNPRTMVHLVKHSGYEVSRTAEFIEKYGSYVLGMLAVLKHSMAFTAMMSPELSVFHERGGPSFKTTENMVRNTIATINTTIDSLEKTLGINSDHDAITDKTDLDAFGACDTFKNLRTLDGADHRRLDTFLRSHNHNGFLGDLYRTTMETGRVKWVCFEHYRTLHSVSSMTSFIGAVEANGGAYSPYLSKAVINLTSTAAAKDFFGKLTSQALALDELDIALDWKFGSSDLAALASAVAQSNLRALRLDMRDDKGKKSAFESMSLGKGRYQPLVQMVSSKNLRGIFLSNVHHLGSRVSGLPQNLTTSTLQRFHLLNVIEPADQVRLANILTSCPSLVDLRLGSFSSHRTMHPTLHHAMTSLKQLKTLHIYNMDTRLPDANVSGDTRKWEDASLSTEALKGLVRTGCVIDHVKKLEGLIQASSGIMEVLVLEFTEKRGEVVELSPAHYQEFANMPQRQSFTALGHAARPFSNLTHLHLRTRITDASIELLASVVWNLSLVHFGADEHSKRLLKYVNFASLKSLSLTDLTEDDMHPLFEAFLDENRPCQLDRMDLKMTGQIRIVPDLLHKIPLRRLELVEISREGMAKIMPILNLSRLEVLSTQLSGGVGYPVHQYYDDIEPALAARMKQLGDNFLLQCEKLIPVPSSTLSARLEGSEDRLKAQHIVFVKRAELDNQHWHSILSTVF